MDSYYTVRIPNIWQFFVQAEGAEFHRFEISICNLIRISSEYHLKPQVWAVQMRDWFYIRMQIRLQWIQTLSAQGQR